MSEITKACERCSGRGTTVKHDLETRIDRTYTCYVCSGTGRVPDVEATLRAEVARLTEERDSSNRTAESRREAIVALMVDIATAKSRELAEYTSRNAAQLDVKRLATVVERLTADNRVMQLERIIHPPGGDHPDVRNAREQTRLARDWLAQEKAHSERLQDSVYELRSKVTKLELREPTQAEGDAAEGKPDETGRVWAVGSCWLGRTGRRCLDCKRWTWGGPTRCERCAELAEVTRLTATIAGRDGSVELEVGAP